MFLPPPDLVVILMFLLAQSFCYVILPPSFSFSQGYSSGLEALAHQIHPVLIMAP
jgi:hypothetical protein